MHVESVGSCRRGGAMWRVLSVCASGIVLLLLVVGCGGESAASPSASGTAWHERLSPEASALEEYSLLIGPGYTSQADVLRAYARARKATESGDAQGLQKAIDDGVSSLKEAKDQLQAVAAPASAPAALSDLQTRLDREDGRRHHERRATRRRPPASRVPVKHDPRPDSTEMRSWPRNGSMTWGAS